MGNHCFKRQCNNFHPPIISLDSSFLWGARQIPAYVHIHTYGQFRTYIYVDGVPRMRDREHVQIYPDKFEFKHTAFLL